MHELFLSLIRCDLNADCVDGSDEMGCDHSTKKKMCQPNQFKCSDGKCIDMSNVCDGVDVINSNYFEENLSILIQSFSDSY